MVITFRSLGLVLLTVSLSVLESLSAIEPPTSGIGPTGPRRVNREYVESLIEARRAKVLSDDQIRAALEDIHEARGNVRNRLARRYFEEQRLDDLHGLAVQEAIHQGILPPSASNQSRDQIATLIWNPDVARGMHDIAVNEPTSPIDHERSIQELEDAAKAASESLRARRELRFLESLLNQSDREIPPREDLEIYSKVITKKSRMLRHSKLDSKADISKTRFIEGVQDELSDQIKRSDGMIDDTNLPESIAKIMRDRAVLKEAHGPISHEVIMDPQGAEERALHDILTGLQWIDEHESGHIGDVDRESAAAAMAKLTTDAAIDPNLINDPNLYLPGSGQSELMNRFSRELLNRLERIDLKTSEGLDLLRNSELLRTLKSTDHLDTDVYR